MIQIQKLFFITHTINNLNIQFLRKHFQKKTCFREHLSHFPGKQRLSGS